MAPLSPRSPAQRRLAARARRGRLLTCMSMEPPPEIHLTIQTHLSAAIARQDLWLPQVLWESVAILLTQRDKVRKPLNQHAVLLLG